MKLWKYTTGVVLSSSILLASCGEESLAPPTFPVSQTSPPSSALQSVQSVNLLTGFELRAQELSFDYINPTFQGGGVLARDGNSGTASGIASARLVRPGSSGIIQLELLNPLRIDLDAIASTDARLTGDINFVSQGSTSESDGLGLQVGSRFDLIRSASDDPTQIISRLSAVVENLRVSSETLSPGDQVFISGTTSAFAAEQSILNEATSEQVITDVRLNEGRFSGTFVVQGVQTTARGRCTAQVIPDPNAIDPLQRPTSQGYSVLLSTTLVSEQSEDNMIPDTSRNVVLRINRTRANNTVVTATIPGTIANNGQVIFDVRDLTAGDVFPDGPLAGGDANPSVRDEIFIVADPSTGCNDVTIPPITFPAPPSAEERDAICTIRPIATQGETADSYSIVVQIDPPLPELIGRPVAIRVTRTRESGIATSTTAETLPASTFSASGEAVFNIFERFRILTITADGFTFEEQTVFPFGFLVIPGIPPILDVGVEDEVVISSSPDNICGNANPLTVVVPAPAELPVLTPGSPQFPDGPDVLPTPFSFGPTEPEPEPAP